MISFIDQEIVIHMSPEKFQAHGKVKAEIARVIMTLNLEEDLGEFFPDRTLVTNESVGLSTEPDGAFVTWKTFDAGRARLVQARKTRVIMWSRGGARLDSGKVVSDWSQQDDTERLPELRYHRAGVREYWLVDGRGAELVFQILHYGADGFVAAALRGGWQEITRLWPQLQTGAATPSTGVVAVSSERQVLSHASPHQAEIRSGDV